MSRDKAGQKTNVPASKPLQRTVAILVLAIVALGVWLPAVAGADSSNYALSSADSAFLADLQQRAVLYFLDHSDDHTGLAQDRAPANGLPGTAPASVAATGFNLTALCIADSHGWLLPGEARDRINQTLRFATDHLQQEHGWFYHFVDQRSGRRAWQSEVSTIDTALFLQGMIFAREYMHDPETIALVNRIYGRIDWRWALHGALTLTHGWFPETGFIPYRWDSYSELMGMYLLGIGASKQPLPPESWEAWRRGPRAEYDGQSYLRGGPLFTHQYSHAWFDFCDVHDAFADYWQNSTEATLAQRAWCASQSSRFHHWSRDMWGVTASDSAHGYTAWGEPDGDGGGGGTDGTLVPCAPGGSLPFAPRECLTALRRMREIGGAAVWGRYGFADAFNPETGWVSPDVIGIDNGIILIMAENLRSGLVWRKFMRAPEVQRGMALAGFLPNRQRMTATLAVAGVH